MNSLRLGLLVGATVLGGCAAVPLPDEAARASLVGVSSPTIEIHRPRLVQRNGAVHLELYAVRRSAADITAHAHVDITCHDAAGRVTRIERATLPSGSLPRTSRLPAPHAYILQPIQPPSGTALIEARAHDGLHSDS